MPLALSRASATDRSRAALRERMTLSEATGVLPDSRITGYPTPLSEALVKEK